MGIFSFIKKEAKPQVPTFISIPDAPELAFPEIPEIEAQENNLEEVPEISEEISVPELPELPEAPGIIPDIEEEMAEEKLPELRFATGKRKSPLFVNIDNYRELMEQLNNAKTVLAEHSGFALRLNDIKVSRDESYEKFRNALETIERKLVYIDKIMFEGG